MAHPGRDSLSLRIHLAGYGLGVVISTGSSLGIDGDTFITLEPLIWRMVGVAAHIARAVINFAAARYMER